MIPPSGTSSGRPGAAGCHRLSPRCPCSHHQPFGELLIFFPQSFTVDQFWPATLSHGCYPGTAWCDGAGLLHPSLEPGGHPQTQLDFSKSKYFAPSPGSRRCGLVPPTLSPSFCLRRGGHQAGTVPPATAPPAFCPSVAGPQKYIGGDFGVDELRPRESPGLALPPPSHSVPQPKVTVTKHGPPHWDMATTPAKPGGLS